LRQSAYPSGQAQAQAWFDRALETEIGRRYLNDSLPSALRIAAEGYTIYLDPDQYRIKYLTAATDIGAPADFIRQGYDMVLLGSGMYNRFYDHPGVFAEQVDIYDTFFNGDWEVMVFEHPYDPLAFAESRSEVHLFFLTKEAKQFKAEIQANQ
ncbi:MAG: hypothetical protein JXA89_05810, partial [Anaerolineae bacterium]|nr:hypothetical protein [Anaerolineae bacterium]